MGAAVLAQPVPSNRLTEIPHDPACSPSAEPRDEYAHQEEDDDSVDDAPASIGTMIAPKRNAMPVREAIRKAVCVSEIGPHGATVEPAR
jgi:hypothetical protein